MTDEKIMKIALPTMLHSANEIEAYLESKDRIEELMQKKEFPQK